MEVDQVSGVLHTILTPEEMETIGEASIKKIEEACGKKFEEFLMAKALCETTKTDLDIMKTDYERKIEELTLKAEDESAKYHSSQLSVKEMRIELEDVKQELIKAKEKLFTNEAENDRFRKERNQALAERDTMDSALKRKELEVDRLHYDVLELEKKIKSANAAKCEALTKLEEIGSKEHSLEFKEKRMDQELTMRDNQIARLSQDLDQTLRELQVIRRDQNINSLTMEAKLTEKNEELKIANQTNSFLSEQNVELSAKVEELATKNMKLSNEMSTMMEHYRKELDSQNRLCELLQQDKHDHMQQTKELESAITALRQMLNEATESCGTIETEKKQLELKHAEELANRDKSISDLREELKHANDLLAEAREENVEHAVEKLAPSAAATSRMLKTGMSLTEVYSLYVRTMEKLQIEEKEHEKLKLQTQNILQELEQSAPEIVRQQTENQNLKEANEDITTQLNNMIAQSAETQAEMSALRMKIRAMEGENINFRQERADLSRQVCHLLYEVEKMQNGVASQEMDQSFNSNPNEVISKKLVTFSNVQELQDNNVKLLLVIRDFSAKLVEMEKLQNSMNSATYEAKLEACNNRIHELRDTVDKHCHLLEQCSQQRDRYKKMYHDAMRSYNPGYYSASMNGGNMQGDTLMDGLDEMPLANSSTANETNGNGSSLAAAVAEKDRKVAELESKNQNLQQEMSGIKQEYEAYRREKHSNDVLINEQLDKMRTEIRELSSNNVKLMGTNEFNSEQNRLISKNITTYKSQITALEERNRNYEGTIAKHEASIMYLKEEAMSAQTKLARAEVQLENLKHECRILKDSETRLRTEREILNRERCNQNLLLNNLEMIKVSMERSENEGRLRLESRLDETSRECSALRRRLQEEQDLCREQLACLQRQVETAQKRMEEEIAIAEGHQAELRDVRNELEIKTRKIDDLQRKLHESLSPNDEDNPVTQAKRKIRELENSLAESAVEINSLQAQLATAQEHVKKYAELSESTVKELKDVTELSNQQKETSQKEILALQKSEADLRTQVDELKTELSLKITGAKLTSGDKDSELHTVQLELKTTLEKVADQARELREIREKCNALAEKLHEAEQKYAREMMEHSGDIQQLAQLKEDMQRTQTQFEELQKQRDQAQEHLKTGEECWSNREQKLRTEVSQLEEQLSNLNSQNAALHDQIQNLGTRLSISAAAHNQTLGEVESTNTDNSMIGEDASILHRSLNDEEKHSVEQLLQVIKYLRKEKDIAVARSDILRSENVRIQSELMILEKKFEEVQGELKEMREKTDTVTVTAAKHEEILRKLDTYNAIMDSNRVLREERDGLNQKVRELSQRLLDAEDKLFPLDEKVRELTVKLESSTNENTTLRMDVARQRQRMTSLVERSSKINSDDWKRMQTERENLAKMLVAEKDLLKHANEELNTHKVERARLEGELSSANKQLHACNVQVKKLTDDLEATAAQTAELETLKAKLKATEDSFSDLRIKESQIRKIAKRYKDSFNELKRQTEEQQTGTAESAYVSRESTLDTSASVASVATDESAADVEDMRRQVETAAEEIDTLKKENELLRAKLEKAERSMDVVKDAKTRILTLTEQKNNATRELSTVKGQLQQQLDQMREETDMLKAQYEGRVTRCEKENADADRESKDTISRLTRENEQLTIRLNQLNRQLGLQQAVAKPTTTAGGAGVSEKPAGESPRTANVKPMAGPSQQQSATVTPRRVSETPLASIRPMAVGSRTAAVLPTSQTSSTNVAIVQGSSASASVSTSPAAGVGVSAGTSASNIAASTASAGGSSTAGCTGSSVVASVGGASASVSGTPSTSGLTTALVPPQQQQVHSVTATSSSSCGGTGVTNALGLNEQITASSSPTSSHTDYMPATSSASVAVAAVPPMGTASTSTAESSSSSSSSTSAHAEGENAPQMSSNDQAQQQQVQQAAIAMVMPHVEGGVAQQQSLQQQQPQPHLPQQQQQGNVQLQLQPLQQQQQQSTPQASSSNTVTTTQAGHKRPRDVEGDSSTDNAGQQLAIKPTPAKKRIRMVQVAVDGFQGVSESGLDVEYQVPTSSQRDQEDDIVLVESEEEDDDDEEEEDEEEDVGMADEGTAEADDGPFDGYENEELGGAGVGAYDESEGPDIDEDNNIQSANNEVDVDEDNEIPNPCGTTSTTSTSTSSTSSSTLSAKQTAGQHATPMDTTEDVETSSTSSTSVPAGGSSVAVAGPSTSTQSSSAVESGASTSSTIGGNVSNDAQQLPQIQSTTGTNHSEASTGQQSSLSSSVPLPSTAASSSGTGTASLQSQGAAGAGIVGGSARQVVNPLSRQQQQATHLILMQQNYEHHESADDRIVPSTPTLYAPRRTDGFSVGSPHPQVPTARFTFSETSTSRQSVGVVPTSGGVSDSVGLPEGIDDTRIDLSQLDEATAGGSSGSGGGRSVPTTPQHTTNSEHIVMGGMATPGPSNNALNIIERSSPGGGESQVPDILVSGANIGDGYIPESTTSSTIDPLHPTYSSEALAASDAASSEVLDRSERELLGEDEDDLVDDGVAAGDDTAMDAEANDVDDGTRTTVSETTAAAPTTSGSVETPTTGALSRNAQQSGSASGSGLSSGLSRNNEADTGTSDDRISSEGETLSTTSRPMEESSEAEVLEAPSSNTRSRTSTQRGTPNVTGRHAGRRYSHRGANRTPITWNDGRASLNRSGSQSTGPTHYQPPHMMQQQQQHMQQQQQQQQQQQHQHQQHQQPRGRNPRTGRGRRMNNPYRYQ